MKYTIDKDGLRQGLAMSTVIMAAMVFYTTFTTPYRFWAVMGALMFIQQRYNDPFRERLPILLYSGAGALLVVAPFAMLGELSWWWFAAGLALLAFAGMWLGGVWRPWQGVTTSVLLVAMFAGSLTPLSLQGAQLNVLALEFWLLIGIGLAIVFAWLWDTLIPRRNFPRQALLVFQELQRSLQPSRHFFLGTDLSGDAADPADVPESLTDQSAETTIYTRVAELTADLPIVSKGYALGTCPLASSTLRMGRWLTTLTEALARIPDKALVERAVPGASQLAGTIVEGMGRIVERLEHAVGGSGKSAGGGEPQNWQAADRSTAAALKRSGAMESICNDELTRMDWSAALAVVEVAFCLEQLARDLRKAEQRLEEVLQ